MVWYDCLSTVDWLSKCHFSDSKSNHNYSKINRIWLVIDFSANHYVRYISKVNKRCKVNNKVEKVKTMMNDSTILSCPIFESWGIFTNKICYNEW